MFGRRSCGYSLLIKPLSGTPISTFSSASSQALSHRPRAQRLAACQERLSFPVNRATFSASSNMAAKIELLNAATIEKVNVVWFSHLDAEDALVLPGKDHNMKWFRRDEAFDKLCVDSFSPVLEAIKMSGIQSGDALLKIFKPETSRQWLGLVLLLDQISRNCYRGEASTSVFRVFDPLAVDIARIAIKAQGLPEADPALRWQLAYRQWILMPLMHSEDLAAHEMALQHFEKMATDVDELLQGTVKGGDDNAYEQRAARVFKANEEAVRNQAKMVKVFEQKHYDIIKKFGRFPHRNAPLGREMTPAEQEFLDNGGDTFA